MAIRDYSDQQLEREARFNPTHMSRNVTAINGKDVDLLCSVNDLGNKTVNLKRESIFFVDMNMKSFSWL